MAGRGRVRNTDSDLPPENMRHLTLPAPQLQVVMVPFRRGFLLDDITAAHFAITMHIFYDETTKHKIVYGLPYKKLKD